MDPLIGVTLMLTVAMIGPLGLVVWVMRREEHERRAKIHAAE